MGVKGCMLVYADTNLREALRARPPLDREATLRLANSLFAGDELTGVADGILGWYGFPPEDEIYIGTFVGFSVVVATDFGIDYPSRLPEHFLRVGAGQTIYLHAMHSVVDWFAFAQWNNGRLVRSLSLSPDSGILEDIGPKLAFEEPYWSGLHPAVDDEDDEYPFPFHPLDLGDAALSECFGYQFDESIPLVRYKRTGRE